MKSAALAIALLGLCGSLPVSAADKGKPPDLSGFWMLVREVVSPDPQLARYVPADAAVMKDSGAAEFGRMDFGGLKPRPEALEAARKWDPKQEMTVSNA